MLWALRFLPDFVVGIPVALAIFLFALVTPVARFQLKPGIRLFLDTGFTSFLWRPLIKQEGKRHYLFWNIFHGEDREYNHKLSADHVHSALDMLQA